MSSLPQESWNYSYDSLDRLTLADNIGASAHDQSFGYATNGNMTSSRLSPSTYSYPAVTAAHPHAPNTAGPRSYTYDANGNATSNGTQT